MAPDEYTKYMQTIDIAVFNHSRQQGMGNIIGLISLGKRIYMRSEVTSFYYLKDKGFSVFQVDGLERLERLSETDAMKNICLANNIFTEKRLLQNWEDVFHAHTG